jgi:hypothetical protein
MVMLYRHSLRLKAYRAVTGDFAQQLDPADLRGEIALPLMKLD